MRVLLGLGLYCLMLLSLPVVAQQEASEQQPDVRVIFDVSGSMKENDPEQLSGSALELLAALLPAEGRGGVWTFGETVDNPLPVDEVDGEWREQALSLATSLANYQQFTDIEAAIRQASQSPGRGRRHLVLLTDGVIDVPAEGQDKAAQDAQSRARLLNEVAPRLAEEDVVIHAVAFSPDADLALVEQMAQQTGGLATLAESSESLLRAFLSILERIYPVDQVPLDAQGRFTIDEGVDSFSALLFHEPDAPPLTLIDPEGRRYQAEDRPDAQRWQSESRFDLITIPSPQQGVWRVEGEFGSDSRISVDSSLVLQTSELPPTLYLGFDLPLTVWLAREEERLQGDALPEDIEIRAELQDPDGEAQSGVSLEQSDGRFEGTLPAPALVGNARLVVSAESEAFQRQRIQAANVVPAISAQLDDERSRVMLSAEHPRLDVDNTEPRAELQGETLDVQAEGEARWRIVLPELDPTISVPLLLNASVTLDGETREIRLPRLMLNPNGEITLGEARIDGANVQSQPLGGELDEAPAEEPEQELADRIVSAINAIPRRAQSFLEEAAPGVQRVAREHGDDPRLWILLALPLLFLFLIVKLWRRFVSRRHGKRRRVEEPHV
ncbi:VWA domain-containing protein [Litchfieldella xinjiangensis]|uniref:VWA domain-containing protein n=1 Tax=Litchfieldella xinjiangensis TaxID=1166948 RepID=UPI0006940DF1|nr:vWA domain-containing protein [Halomonas xinjiangensis]